MKFHPAGWYWLLLISLLAACGAPAATPPPVASQITPGPNATATLPPTSADPVGYPAEAGAVVRAFLGSLQENPSGQSSVQYLSSERQREVAQGRPLPVILGLQQIYDSFTVSPTLLLSGSTTARVTAILELRQPVEREFELVQENGEWHIADIIPLAEGSYPPEQIVIDFLDTLRADPSGEQSMPYLSPALRQRLQQDGLALLAIAAPYDSFAAGEPVAIGAEVQITATLRFGSAELQRTFTLIKQGDSWQISAIR